MTGLGKWQPLNILGTTRQIGFCDGTRGPAGGGSLAEPTPLQA